MGDADKAMERHHALYSGEPKPVSMDDQLKNYEEPWQKPLQSWYEDKIVSSNPPTDVAGNTVNVLGEFDGIPRKIIGTLTLRPCWACGKTYVSFTMRE